MQRTLTAAAFAALSMVAHADTTTYICTDAKSRKALQDRPCNGDAVSAEARATKVNPRPLFVTPNVSAMQQSIWCSHYKNEAGRQRDMSNVGTNNHSRAYARDMAIANEARYRRECQ